MVVMALVVSDLGRGVTLRAPWTPMAWRSPIWVGASPCDRPGHVHCGLQGGRKDTPLPVRTGEHLSHSPNGL